MRSRLIAHLAFALSLAGGPAAGQAAEARMTQDIPRPSILSQTTMFYYDDLTAAEVFYGEKLGLEKTRDYGWVKFFRTAPAAEVAIVKTGEGAYFKAQAHNAVMLSIVTDAVDAWYDRLKRQGGIEILVDIQTSKTAPIRNFMVRDPGGYAVEFFQWL
jgi:Glyoxalase/Bleomycin resistance protein/Dioxygenase superfamily